jgi:hypothetical protein
MLFVQYRVEGEVLAMTTPVAEYDFEALRRGIEGRDAGCSLAYAEDAGSLTINKNTPPSLLRGR